MKKKDWGNAVWILFHTLAEKIKPEYTEELIVIVSHITSICNNTINTKISKNTNTI